MRRLCSHIIIAATSLLMIGATFTSVMTKSNSNIEFDTGKELVFRIMQKDDDGNIDKEYVFTDDEAVKQTAEIMEERLNIAEVSRYKIETQGYDTVKVTLNRDNDTQYENIEKYLSFNATLAISNSKETYALASEFMKEGSKAYMQATDSGLPAVVIPIDYDNELFQAVYTEAKEMADSGTGEFVQVEEAESEDEEDVETHFAFLYLWYDYIPEHYTYDKINPLNEETYDPTVANKLLLSFNASNPFLDVDKDELISVVSSTPSSELATITPDQLRESYENARYFVNLLNASEMPYHVDFLFAQKAKLWEEDLFALGDHMTIAWSKLFIATLCAIGVTSLLLIYFYRLGALSIATVSIASTFFGLLFVVLLGAEFTIATIVGLVMLSLTSIISGIIYLNKFKEECYRGRSLKKANSEGAKKALLPTVDIHVVLIALGTACYLLGGVIMKSFAIVTIIGGLVSLILNIVGLRGLMWLVTNENKLAGRYDLFDISEDQVPNALEEEKQKYFGANADKDFTKLKKPLGIASLVLLVASFASLLTFGIINNGAVYNSTSTHGNSQLYIEYTSETADNTLLSAQVKDQVDTLLEHSYLGEQKLADIAEIETIDYITNFDSTTVGLVTIYNGYYRVNFDREIKADQIITYVVDGTEVENQPASTFFTIDILNSTSGANLNFSNRVSVALKDNIRVNQDQPKFGYIYLATAVGIAISSLYLLLRYRLTRGLSSLVLTVVATTITAGLFCLLQFLPVTSYVSLAMPFVALFVSSLFIILMNKERSMLLDVRLKDQTLETRNELLNKATALSSTPITIAFIIALYLGVNYFAFNSGIISWVFLLIILGSVISVGFALYLFAAHASFYHKLLLKVYVKKDKPNKKKKARPVRVNKSAEPEEAIFIGINDY